MKKMLGALLVVMALAATACGGGGSDEGGDKDTTPDVAAGDTGIDQAGVPDVQEVEPPEEVVPDTGAPDVPVDQGTPKACEPACVYADGQYCDESAFECKTVTCQSCYKNTQCEGGKWCLDFTFAGGSTMGVCSNDCTDDAGCDEGFECNTDLGYCVPRALCTSQACGTGELGAPCEYQGVNAGCGSCKEGLNCLGFKPQPSYACTTDKDCVMLNGLDMSNNPDCVNGKCGGSFCSPDCDDKGQCPEGFVSGGSLTNCYCVPVDVGTSKAGEPCPFSEVNFEADACEADMACLGIGPSEDTLPCTEDTDCSPAWYPGGPDCIEGRCSTSFCSPLCDDQGECLEGFIPIDVSDICYCLPTVTGNGKVDTACPFGNVNTDEEVCSEDLACVGIAADDWSKECTQDVDCEKGLFGLTECFMGKCGGSVCAALCDAQGKCPAGHVPWLLGGAYCYCIGPSKQVGTVKAGEGCAFANLNMDAGNCASGLACMGLLAVDDPDNECKTAADCDPEKNPGGVECINGYCGSSFCSPRCDDKGQCPVGYAPFGGEEEDSSCYCWALPVGQTPEGGACPFDTVHETEDWCEGGLACLGIPADEGSALCTKDSDCGNVPYMGNGKCVAGLCGTSLCSAACDKDGKCPEGQEPFNVDIGCFCLPAYIGAADAGEACALANIHQDKDDCLADMDCIGLYATGDSAECTKDTDCPEEYPGVAQCFEGHCGASSCMSRCDDTGACEAGFTAQLTGSWCHCVPSQGTGKAKLGEACEFLFTNVAADSCAAGLACLGSVPIGSDACQKADDCAAADYPGVAVCQDGLCASSYCAPACDADGACVEGYEPVDGLQDCYCSQVAAE